MISNKMEIALRIYINNVDLEEPLFHKEMIKKCIHAADIWMIGDDSFDHIKTEKLNKIVLQYKLGRTIPCIKEIRTLTGFGLKISKDIYDKARRELIDQGDIGDNIVTSVFAQLLQEKGFNV